MGKKKTTPDSDKKNENLEKILIGIKAFDQVQTTDRLRQWLENPDRRPKNEATFPTKSKRKKK